MSWQVVPERLIEMIGAEDAEKASRTTRAMLGRGELDIAALQRAYDGS